MVWKMTQSSEKLVGGVINSLPRTIEKRENQKADVMMGSCELFTQRSIIGLSECRGVKYVDFGKHCVGIAKSSIAKHGVSMFVHRQKERLGV